MRHMRVQTVVAEYAVMKRKHSIIEFYRANIYSIFESVNTQNLETAAL